MKSPLLCREGLLNGWVLALPLLAVSALAQAQTTDAGALPATADGAVQELDAGQDAAADQSPAALEQPAAAAEEPPAAGEQSPDAEEPQPDAEELPPDTGEMVVTARRRKETLQSVPVAVTALNEKQLESSSIRDVSDLNGRAPGFTANQGGSQVTPGALSTAIRGIGIIEVEKSYELPVGTMIDGIILGNAVGSNVANFDLESVEILRGAQGTLFGRNVTAGLISLRTVRPNNQEYTGKAAFTLGSFNRRDLKLAVNVPVIENVLAARAAVMWLTEDGYMNRIANNVDTGKNAPSLNQLYAVGSLLFTPTKDLDVYLKYEHQRYRGQGLPSIVASDARTSFLCASHPGDPNYCRPQNAQGQNIDLNDLSNRQKLSDQSNGRQDQEYDLNAITGEVTYRLSPKYSFVSLTGWRAFDDDSWTDIDATPDNQVNAHRFGPYKQVTEELRFHAKPDPDLNLVAGLYGWYSHYRAISETRQLLETVLFDRSPAGIDNPVTPWDELTDGVNPPGSFNVADAQQTSYSAAAFAQADWEFLTNTTLTLGGRLTHDIKDLKAVFYTERPGVYMGESYPRSVVTFPPDADGQPFAADDPSAHALADKDSWTRFTAKANLSYMFDEDLIGEDNSLLLYGGYASGFRSGGFNGRPATVKVAKPYDPETVDQFELGVKSSLGRGVFVANLAGYYTLYHDKQESYQIPDTGTSQGYASAYGNAGEASIKGLELELSSMPLRGNVPVIDRFRLWGAGALTDAQYDDFKVALSGTTVHDYAKGEYKIEMRLAPVIQVAAGLDLPFEFPGGVGRIVPSVSYRYRSEQRVELTTDPDGHPNGLGMSDQAGYLDTSLTAELDDFLSLQWRLTGYVRNVTDYVELLGANNVGIGTRAVFGRPRTWGLEIQARYN
jgi:iron complex outermembrane receptor protein